MTDSLTLSVISDADGLRALGPDWDRLVLAAQRPSPFFLHDWITVWWRHFGAGATLAVVTARRDGALVGLAPLFIRRRRGLRVCSFLGHQPALADLLVAPGEDGSIARALLDRVAQLRFHYLDVFGAPPGGVLPRACTNAELTVLQRVEAPVLRMPEGWEAAYAAHVAGKKRNLHRRRVRQLAELGALSWTTARTPEDVARELEHVFEIHARRWQGRPDGSSFGMRGGHEFHREVARALAARDIVRILMLRIDGRPVAFHYWFLLGTTMYVHRLAFDPELARFSPGQVTLLQAIANASSEGARRVEFLEGDERYKLELADELEPLHQIIGLPNGLLARSAVGMLLLSIRMRLRLKRNKRLHRLYLQGLSPLHRALGRFGRSPTPAVAEE
jgi:CelD/BcsL family acetyltransferase involved in cellulose biosynthesis